MVSVEGKEGEEEEQKQIFAHVLKEEEKDALIAGGRRRGQRCWKRKRNT